MPEDTYTLMPYSQRLPSLSSLLELNRLTFSDYVGVIDPQESFLSWYLARPGLDHDLSWAAWHEGQPVSSLFVTCCTLALAGEPRRVGIVDTVMTHPSHRRRGLARALLTAAIAASRAAGLDALQLYTSPGSAGYHLYRSLGFQDWAQLHYWERPAESGPGPRLAGWVSVGTEEEHRAVRDALQAAAAQYDGLPQHDDRSWRWRRLDRPSSMPAEVWLRTEGSAGPETVTAAPVSLTGLGQRLVLSDAVIAEARCFAGLCRHLAGRAPLVAIAEERDRLLTEVLTNAGFRRGQAEAALLLGLSPQVPKEPGPRPWFPLSESIIGV